MGAVFLLPLLVVSARVSARAASPCSTPRTRLSPPLPAGAEEHIGNRRYLDRLDAPSRLSRRLSPGPPVASAACVTHHLRDASVLDQHSGQELRLHRAARAERRVVDSAIAAFLGDGAKVKLPLQPRGGRDGMTHFLLPFMVFTILGSLLTQNPDLRRAAEIVGVGPLRISRASRCP